VYIFVYTSNALMACGLGNGTRSIGATYIMDIPKTQQNLGPSIRLKSPALQNNFLKKKKLMPINSVDTSF
jgi:hypothetical protein